MAKIATTREMQSCKPLAANLPGFLYTARLAMLRRQELTLSLEERQHTEEQEAEKRFLEKTLKERGMKGVREETLDDEGADYPPFTEDDFTYPDQNEENGD